MLYLILLALGAWALMALLKPFALLTLAAATLLSKEGMELAYELPSILRRDKEKKDELVKWVRDAWAKYQDKDTAEGTSDPQDSKDESNDGSNKTQQAGKKKTGRKKKAFVYDARQTLQDSKKEPKQA